MLDFEIIARVLYSQAQVSVDYRPDVRMWQRLKRAVDRITVAEQSCTGKIAGNAALRRSSFFVLSKPPHP